ncbi:MAG: ABC transporter substrate-binding protein, partial [Mesorhizobium sp.]
MRKMLFLATTILAAALYSASANAEQKEVTVWSWFVQSTMEKSIAAFEKAHPDIKVKYTYYNYSP